MLELYAHLVLWDSPNPTICFQGVDISLNAQFVNLAPSAEGSSWSLPGQAEGDEYGIVVEYSGGRERYWEEVDWFTTDGRTSHYYLRDARRWLIIVGWRICPSGNLIDATYSRAVVVGCIIVGISMKVEGSNCGRGERFLLRQQELSFPSWLSVCTMKASMGSLRWHELWGWTWCAFNPLRVRKEPFRAPKKRKMDEGKPSSS